MHDCKTTLHALRVCSEVVSLGSTGQLRILHTLKRHQVPRQCWITEPLGKS